MRCYPRASWKSRVAGYTSLRPFLVNGAGYGGLIGTVSDAARFAAVDAAGPTDLHLLLDQEQRRAITARGKRFDHGIGRFRKLADAKRSQRLSSTAAPVAACGMPCASTPKTDRHGRHGQHNAQWIVDLLFTGLKDMTWT